MSKPLCWMYRSQPPDGGGHCVVHPPITVRRTAALGDVLSATVIAQRLHDLGYAVTFQTHPHCQALLKHVSNLDQVTSPNGYAHVNLDGAYETHPHRKRLHFRDAWFQKAQRDLAPLAVDLGKPKNARPRITLSREQREMARTRFADVPRPVILICPASQYYNVRAVPDRVWEAAAKQINGSVFWIGLTPAPGGIKDLSVRTMDSLVSVIAGADLLVTVDTGPMHIAAALDTKVLAIGQSSPPGLHLTDQNDWQLIEPPLDCLGCQENVCPKDRYLPPCQNIDPDQIAASVNRMVSGKISCLIPTFAAAPESINRCITQVSGQVDEVIVTAAADATVPSLSGARVVRSKESQLGFGRNVNFGMRHTTGDCVLLLNDDCYLEPGCVQALLKLRAPDVGMIAHLLRYPNGKIYFAGRRRKPGERGFPHIDHNAYLPSVTSVMEMEALSGTSVLINRKAFYQIGGFDERFMMYAEDDDVSMRMRQAGYRLLYEPNALGVHEGSATAKKSLDINRAIHESGQLMESLWGWYYDLNRDRVPGLFK
jgi:GT2 family glycosyltransferase/ADP-heptose:LPS heptosyltransferase